MTRALLDLIMLEGFGHMDNLINIYCDILDGSCWEATIDLKIWEPHVASP
jgi:hypothetical protein